MGSVTPVSPPPEIFKAYDIRGVYGRDLDEDLAEAIGRAFVRVLGRLEGKPPGELRIGLGRDMRHTAPSMAARYREGMVAEGATVVDAGMVATEMTYFLVGSHDLDGGLMCTPSHNPKAYTGAKLLRRGALALSGDAGIQDVRRAIDEGLGEAPGGGRVEEVDVYDDFHRHVMGFVDPGSIRPLRLVVDGSNGMAGPMVGPLLEQLGLDPVTAHWEPDGEFPDRGPNPLLEENQRSIVERVKEHDADVGIAWDGDADRCFFIDSHGEFVAGDFLTALLAQSILRKEPGATILYDVRASRAVPDIVERAGGRALINRVGHAFFKTRMRSEHAAFGGEVSGHYYFRDFYCADSGPAGARAAVGRGQAHDRAAGAAAREVLHLRRDQLRGGRPAGEGRRAGRALLGRPADHAGRALRRLRRLALQRAAVQHRAAAAAQPRVAGVARAHGGKARRGARDHPLVSGYERAARAGIHRLAIPTPFAVGRVNTYLIEDAPLTLVDSGPNSAKALDELERALADHGHAVEDLELLVVSHQHIDHLGLLDVLARRSGAEVAALDVLAPYVERYGEDAERDDEFAEALMLRHGLPPDVVYALRSVSRAFRAWGSSASVTRRLRDGERLELRDRTLDVLHRPGHSPTDTVFWDAERRILLAADHLLAHISSNPLISREPGADPDPDRRPQALVRYLDSLARTRELPVELVLPGHGDPIDDHVAVIDERFRLHAGRAEKIHGLIAERPRTAYEIAQALWGNVAVTQAFLTLSEVLGHVDLLLNEGRVREVREGDVVRFAVAG
jgi:phosphomannomutase